MSAVNYPKIRQSSLKKFMADPAKYLYDRRNPPAPSGAQAFGSAFDCLLLQPELFTERYAIAPDCDRRTKAGKEAAAEFEAAAGGKIVVTAADYDLLCGMKESAGVIGKHIDGSEVQKQADGKVFGFAATGTLDLYRDGLILDVKTTRDAGPGFRWDIKNFGYDVQLRFYQRLLGLEDTDCTLGIFAIEKTAPFSYSMWEIGEGAKQRADAWIEEACGMYVQAYASGIFKPYHGKLNEYD